MSKVIVIGNRLESSGPDHLLPEIWKPENWVLVRQSALALHTSCADGERMLVSGINSRPPVGTIICASEIYSSYPEDSQTSHFSGIWMYTTARHRRSIDAYFRHLKELTQMDFSRLIKSLAMDEIKLEHLFNSTNQMYKG